ncbi:PD-(D/E)XK nuclease family protein [Anaerobaca lacustris]|uniref:PD-(D/E)XK nuclease family protein n=1 Tax=Anaerobaca lacustris TaxID=3044600 RepID=A0AAW6U292_9BACT|nr:PD-(D/E)XK nuclease family protein [Sedimentisphaerales bacterium M17dextr]
MDPSTVYFGAMIGYWVFRGIKSWLEEAEHSTNVAGPVEPQQARLLPTSITKTTEEHPAPRYTSVSDLIRNTYISYSKLRCYQECPHKFRLTYLDGAREDRSPFTGDGKTFHKHAESTLRSFIGCSVREAQDRVATRDRRLRRLFQYLPQDSYIKAVEHRLGFTLHEVRYFGIVDLVICDSDGTIRLVDYKTGHNPKIHIEQLELYCMPILLRSAEARVRCSFILVDTDKHVYWEVGPGNRNDVIRNLVRRVNALIFDTQLKPFINTKCKDCTVAQACTHRNGRHSPERPVPTLTSGIRGAASRMRDLDKRNSKKLPDATRGPTNGGSFHAVVGKAEYRCAETGRVIAVGERHFTTHKGQRLCVTGFQKRFPGLPLPAERLRGSTQRQGSTAKSFQPVVGKAEYKCVETGRVIPIGERHFTTHKGERLCVAGFRKRFPDFHFTGGQR